MSQKIPDSGYTKRMQQDTLFKSSFKGPVSGQQITQQLNPDNRGAYEDFYRWKKQQEEEEQKLKPEAMTVERNPNQLVVNVPYSTYGRGLVLDLKKNPLNSTIPTRTVLTDSGFQIIIDIPNKYGLTQTQKLQQEEEQKQQMI